MTFLDIGDVPTGFMAYDNLKSLALRPFVIKDLSLLDLGARSGNISHLLKAIDACADTDIYELTEGDFQFACAWLRLHSYPKTPSQVSWQCNNQFLVKATTDELYGGPTDLTEDQMLRFDLKYETCGRKNVEIVHNSSTRIVSLDDDFAGLPEGTDFPRVRTMHETDKILEQDPDMGDVVRMARWIKEGETVQDKIEVLHAQEDFDLWYKIQEAQRIGNHGIYEIHPLRCRGCNNTLTHTAAFNLKTFFADNRDQDIMDIQYSLLSEFGMQPDDTMPSKKLLYLYSCLAKDKQEAEERRRLQEAVSSRTR